MLNGLVDRWGDGAALSAWAPSRSHDRALRAGGVGCSGWGRAPAWPGSCSPSTASADVRGILGAIHVPTLVMQRRGDHLIRVEVGRYLAEQIPDARFVELDGDDHLFFVGDVDQPLAEIEEFLTGCRPATVGAGAGAGDRALRRRRRLHRAGGPDRRRLVGVDPGLVPGRRPARELARYSGTEVDVAGDGLFATFTGPARAIRCAMAIRRSVGALGLEVRAGVHAGEVQREAGGGVSGLAVHIGARVMAEAEPGEVLVSGTVKDLVVGSGLEFAERGTRTLRGVPGSWPVFAVVG